MDLPGSKPVFRVATLDLVFSWVLDGYPRFGALTLDLAWFRMKGLGRLMWHFIRQSPPGENIVKKTDKKLYRDRLLALRARLRGDVNHMAEAALNKNRMDGSGELSSMPIHMADIGSDNFEQEFTLSLVQSDEDTLGKIESSLERIEEGTYGTCEECGARIPKTRLNAIPYAEFCVRCAEQLEQAR